MAIESLFGVLPDHWETTTLGNICQRGGGFIQTGPFGSQLHAADYVEIGIPTIMPKNIGENKVIEDGISRITQKDAERLSKYRVKSGDIVYSRRGDVTLRALIREHQNGWLCGTGSLMVRLGEGMVDPRFVSYYLSDPSIREWIQRHAVGATMPNLNTSIMGAVPFIHPPLSEQRAIAGILGALDDKIELNRRMNRTLESMARAVFRQWFVESNGVESWKVGKLGDVAENIRCSANAEDIEPETHYIGLEHMPRGSIALSEWGNASELASNKFIFKEGEFLFGKLRPYFHKVGIAPIDGVCSTDILVIAPKSPDWYGFVLGHISSVELINHTNAASTGTKMPRTSWSDIANYEVAIPPVKMAKEFSEMFLPMAQQIRANIMQSHMLASLRDTLLPRLMRGEVRVKDV